MSVDISQLPLGPRNTHIHRLPPRIGIRHIIRTILVETAPENRLSFLKEAPDAFLVVSLLEQLPQQPRVQQVRRLRATGPAVHQLAHQRRRHGRRALRDLGRQLQRPGYRGFRRGQDLGEERRQERVVGRVDGARRGEVQRAREADQPRQEERRGGLHDEAAAGEDEADLGAAVGDADRRGEGHGDADPDGGAVDRDDGGLAAVVDREGYLASTGFSIPVSQKVLPTPAGNAATNLSR